MQSAGADRVRREGEGPDHALEEEGHDQGQKDLSQGQDGQGRKMCMLTFIYVNFCFFHYAILNMLWLVS